MAVCWIARQVPLTRGGIVADEQGLGKPTESLVFCAVVAQLAYSHQHVRESPDRHLAPDAPSDAKCEYSKRMMIPCVCEKGCPFFLKKWVPTGAQVIIVKAQTRKWQHEFAKTFDTNFVHQAKLVLVLGHGQLKPNQKKPAVPPLGRPTPIVMAMLSHVQSSVEANPNMASLPKLRLTTCSMLRVRISRRSWSVPVHLASSIVTEAGG